jgi:hypothetical protein
MINLKPGDLFASKSNSWLGYGIRSIQWFWSTDNESTYNHVGIIMGVNGTTLEARSRFNEFNIKDYINSQVLIVRHNSMTIERCRNGYKAIVSDINCYYPIWRFPFFILHLEKFLRFGNGVCSEQTGKFMDGAGFKNIVYGLTPDDLSDRWKIDKDMKIIFEGILKKGDLSCLG